MRPLVSIVIPVYNGGDYLNYAIDSALNQTYSNIEVIVVNDGSNDNGRTKEIMESYGDRIRAFHKQNGGVATALNYAISKMKGDYFSWLSHDDIYLPSKIESNLKCIESVSNETIVYSGVELIDDTGNHIGNIAISDYYSNENLASSYFSLYMGLINGCTLLIPKYVFSSVGTFDESLKTTQDYDLWFRMFKNRKLIFDNNIFVQSRIHTNQGSRTISTHQNEMDLLWLKMLKGIDDNDKIDAFGSTNRYLLAMCERMNQIAGMPKTKRYLAESLKVAQTNVKTLEKKCEKIYIPGDNEKFHTIIINTITYLRKNGIKHTLSRVAAELKHNDKL